MLTWSGQHAEHGLAGLPRPAGRRSCPEALRDRELKLRLAEPPTQIRAMH
ncbi:hypothetical protein ACI79G_07950 [Geodermatophilus sp. SYSU D00779]